MEAVKVAGHPECRTRLGPTLSLLIIPSTHPLLIHRVFSGQKRPGKQFTMADTDEAAIHLPNSSHDSAPQIETDLSDETQDFRFLNNLAL